MKDELGGIWLVALAVLGWLVWDRVTRLPPPPAPPKLRPRPASADETGIVDGVVQTYDKIAQRVGVDKCIEYGGSPDACKWGVEALKYANPITATVHVGAAAVDYIGDKLDDWF